MQHFIQCFVVCTLVDTEYGNVITYVDGSCHSLNDSLDITLEYLSRSVYSKRESLVLVQSNMSRERCYVTTRRVEHQLVIPWAQIDLTEECCTIELRDKFV